MASSLFDRTKVFISYSHTDAKYLKRLQVHLAFYERNKLVDYWDDTKITPGAKWQDEIEKALVSAKVAILLISADFLASRFVTEKELPLLLAAAQREGTTILPIIVSPCGFEYSKLSQFQAENSPKKPLTSMNYNDREVLWARVTKRIVDAINSQESESFSFDNHQSRTDSRAEKLSIKDATARTKTVSWDAEPKSQMFLPTGTYKREWGTTDPGCLIFLLDQSNSMSKPFDMRQAGNTRQLCDVVAMAINGFINELIIVNSLPHSDYSVEVRPRVDVAVFGYGDGRAYSLLSGALANNIFVTLPDLQMNPIDIETRRRKEIDDIGLEIEIPVQFPIWVKPRASGNAAMCAALGQARDLAHRWAMAHPDNYPPIIINITYGVAEDGDPLKVAQELIQISTNDGQALLFNVHITTLSAPTLHYPLSEAELPNDRYAKLLFNMSSIIPERNRNLLQALIGRDVSLGARGFIFNGDMGSFRLMFPFASSRPASAPLDPNR